LLLFALDVSELPGEDVRFPVLIIQSVLSDGVFCVFLVMTIFNGFASAFEPLCMLLVAEDCLLIGVIILGRDVIYGTKVTCERGAWNSTLAVN